ncbi:hypothetical protein [Winslowiella arboricola]
MEYYEFIETSIFTRQIEALLEDEEYLKFQEMLLVNPKAGDVIKGTGGCRKVRFAVAEKIKGRAEAFAISIIFRKLTAGYGYSWLIQRTEKTA